MSKNISEIVDFLMEYLQNEYTISNVEDIMDFNYMEEGYVDSIGIISFMTIIEDEFDILFSDEEINSKEFRIVGSLANMIKNKIDKK